MRTRILARHWEKPGKRHNAKRQQWFTNIYRSLGFVVSTCVKLNIRNKISTIASRWSCPSSRDTRTFIPSMLIWWMYCMTEITTNCHLVRLGKGYSIYFISFKPNVDAVHKTTVCFCLIVFTKFNLKIFYLKIIEQKYGKTSDRRSRTWLWSTTQIRWFSVQV